MLGYCDILVVSGRVREKSKQQKIKERIKLNLSGNNTRWI
jgi:hypothetical protein